MTTSRKKLWTSKALARCIRVARLGGLALAIVVLTNLPLWAASPGQVRYMVRLGTFKTPEGLKEAYYSIPEELRSRALVCRSGQYYTLHCGSSDKSQELDPLFKRFKDLGLEPMIVKMELATCKPAKEFLFSLDAPREAKAPRPKTVQKVEQPYSDLSDPIVRKYLKAGGVRVLPEVATKVVLSNRDVNRITCSEGAIKDIIYSKEKGISVKAQGRDAFVKFLINRDPMTGELLYASAPSEFYVVCGEDSTIYTLIALPRNVPAQAIQLVSTKKKLEKNISLLEGIPFEKRVVMLVKAAYRDEVPDTFTESRHDKELNIFRHVRVRLARTVVAEGEGLLLKEYLLLLKDSYPGRERTVKETFFLRPELAKNPVGVALEKLVLRKGKPSRLFIVERTTR